MNAHDSFRISNTSLDVDFDDIISPELREQVDEECVHTLNSVLMPWPPVFRGGTT